MKDEELKLEEIESSHTLGGAGKVVREVVRREGAVLLFCLCLFLFTVGYCVFICNWI